MDFDGEGRIVLVSSVPLVDEPQLLETSVVIDDHRQLEGEGGKSPLLLGADRLVEGEPFVAFEPTNEALLMGEEEPLQQAFGSIMTVLQDDTHVLGLTCAKAPPTDSNL